MSYFGNAIQSIPTVASTGDVLSRDLRWCADLLHRNVVAHDNDTVRLGVADWERDPRLFPLGNFEEWWGYDDKISAFSGREGNRSVDLEVVLSPETMAMLKIDTEFMQYESRTDRRPWSLKGKHLILKKYNPDWSLNEVDFSTIDFWVQIHGLPFNKQFKSSVPRIGRIVGEVLDVDLTGHDIKDYHENEIQKLWKEKVTLGIHGNWLRSEASEFQPGIDLEELKNSDLAECGSSAVQLVLDVRNEQRFHKPLEQTESMVKDSLVADEVEIRPEGMVVAVIALVYSDPHESPWLLILVYGPPYLAKRRKFWELMENLILSFSGLWLLIGDLNSTMHNSEKSGGSQKGDCSSNSFRSFVNNVGAVDLDFSGPCFTWSNRKVGWANVRCRLDRGLYNPDWLALFPQAGVRHITASNSDHNPITLDTHLEVTKGTKPFHFEAMWAKDLASSDVVDNTWHVSIDGPQDLRRRNFIAGIQLANGNWIHSRKDIEGYFASEFQSIFQSSHPQIPLLLEANKVKDFAFMKEKLESRVSGWKSKCLSWAGRATLIKSVAQATPIYGMSVFKLPKALCSNLDAIVRKFWWCPRKDSNKFYTPMAWESLCKPRSQGGLGFRKFERFNEAMLAKLAWTAKAASFVRKGLENSRVLLTRGACCMVGSRLSTLSHSGSIYWDFGKLSQQFDEESVATILNIPRRNWVQQDTWCWSLTTNSQMTVKSAYKELCLHASQSGSAPLMEKIWKLSIHERLKMHLWRIASNLLPSKASISTFTPTLDTICYLYENSPETITHLLWECSLARALWLCGSVFILWGTFLFDLLWRMRNDKVHGNKVIVMDTIIRDLNARLYEHWSVRKVSTSSPAPTTMRWIAPTQNYIKINCNATIGSSCSILAVVARDWRRTFVLALSKKANTTIPLQAEAEAILWAVQIASDRGWNSVIVESNSKLCIDALCGVSMDYPWRINDCISCILLCLKNRPGWSFSWTRRVANSAPHTLVGWSLKNSLWDPFFFGNGP
uniref:Ribonucleotide reductase large subunit domain-containing protein n=1 Tax=Fagus sylvatica TaxID=28930 RepID=A0A2N9HDP5_FAGSY